MSSLRFQDSRLRCTNIYIYVPLINSPNMTVLWVELCTPQRIFDKNAKTVHYRKDNLFNGWWCVNWMFTCKWIIWIPIPHRTKSNSKWNEDLEENVATIFVTLVRLGNSFLGMTPKQAAKEKKKIGKLSLLKIFLNVPQRTLSREWEK